MNGKYFVIFRGGTAETASSVLDAANDLKAHSGRLSGAVDEFLTTIRAA